MRDADMASLKEKTKQLFRQCDLEQKLIEYNRIEVFTKGFDDIPSMFFDLSKTRAIV